MTYQDSVNEMDELRAKMGGLREELRKIQEGIEAEETQDYVFSTQDGEVLLSSLFKGKDTLFVIHNMGKSCAYCTQWADGFNGVLAHLEDRAAFVVSSPDKPEKQATFAEGRGWRFTMVSHYGTTFAKDMGYRGDDGFRPGVSVFQHKDGKILRVSDTTFGPYDEFNPVWRLFDMIPEGAGAWEAKFDY
jgi:predicted dithiol-disulfide oxidoreductase (DUF899 family)